jgi:hypothetical protein
MLGSHCYKVLKDIFGFLVSLYFVTIVLSFCLAIFSGFCLGITSLLAVLITIVVSVSFAELSELWKDIVTGFTTLAKLYTNFFET